MKKTITFFKTLLLAVVLLVGSGSVFGTTPYVMSTGNYSEDFADIANWSNNYAAGTGANNWRVATSVVTSSINTNAVFATSGTAGGVHKGVAKLTLLATGTNSSATDLLLNFSNREAGTISLDYEKVVNSANTSPKSSDLKIQYSIDNGVTFADLAGYTIPRVLNNSTAQSGTLSEISLPSALDNQSQVVIRFFVWNNGQTGGSGNRPKISIDNVTITSTAISSCTALGTPTVTPTAGNAEATLSWDAVANATSYTLIWNGGTAETNVTSPVTKTGLINGTSYSYSLMAVGDGTTYCATNTAATGNVTPEGTPTASTPTITPSGALKATDDYWNTSTITLASATSGATIYYTTNGDVPTAASTEYTTPFAITQTSTIKAIAIKSGLDNSAIATRTITISTPPVATVPYSESFSNTLGDWTSYSVAGSKPVLATVDGAYFNGYNGGSVDTWFISPKFTATSAGLLMNFNYASKYVGNDLVVKYSTDYVGYGSPSAATWTTLSNILAPITEDTYTVKASGDITTAATGTTYFALVYTTASNYSDWRITNMTVVTNVPTPSISITPATLTGFTYAQGSGPSVEKSFTVSGTNLTNDISITATTNYEISKTSGSGYATPLTFTPAEVATAQTVYVRLKSGLNEGTYNSEVLNITSIDASTKTVTCSGSVTPLVAPTATAATAVSATGFTANWNAASGATSYDVSVYTKTGGGNASDLFISEYIEGSSFNKAIEIYNGTGATVDLSAYSLKKQANGKGIYGSELILSGTLANNDVYVLAYVSGENSANSNILAVTDLQTSSGAINYNGNDAVGLFKNGTQIDEVGIFNQTSDWGAEVTLVRNSSISSPVVPYSVTDWISNTQDETSFLGSHTFSGGSTNTQISGSPFTVTGSTNKEVTGLNSGTAYYYTLVAKDGVSSSNASNEITAITNVVGSTNASSLPSCATCDLVINNTGTFTIDAAKTYNSITVESGGKLNTTAPLTVGNLILKAVKDESSFSSIIDATITATSAKLFKTIDDTKWYYMAFPCDVTVADITKSNGESIGVLGTDWFIKYYDGEQRGNNGTAQTNWKHIEAIPVLTANRGYIFGLKTGTVELSIPLNSSVLEAELTDKNIAVAANTGAAGTIHQGWNLIGHPYMSKYNARSNGSAPDYMIMPNPDGKTYTQTSKGAGTLPTDLKPFAAYFVQVGAAGNIGFGRNGRQNVPASVAAEVSENIRLNLTTATGADYTYLIMDNDQTTEYQIGEDMVKWLGTGTDVPQVYTLIGDVSYAFNALPMASVVNLPIGLYTKNAGASTISVNALQAPSLSKLLLTDKKENITTDLLVSDYSFNATAGSDNTRFVMSAQRISTGDQINLIDAPSVISSNGKLIINELSPKTNIRIYDATGRLVMSKVAMERSIEIPLQVVGMYAVHIDAGIKNWTIKIVNNK